MQCNALAKVSQNSEHPSTHPHPPKNLSLIQKPRSGHCGVNALSFPSSYSLARLVHPIASYSSYAKEEMQTV